MTKHVGAAALFLAFACPASAFQAFGACLLSGTVRRGDTCTEVHVAFVSNSTQALLHMRTECDGGFRSAADI